MIEFFIHFFLICYQIPNNNETKSGSEFRWSEEKNKQTKKFTIKFELKTVWIFYHCTYIIYKNLKNATLDVKDQWRPYTSHPIYLIIYDMHSSPPPSSFRCSTILCINAPSTIHHYKRPVHPIRHNLQSYPTHIPWFPTLFLYLSSIRQLPPVQQHYGLPHCVPGKNHYSKCGWWRRIQFDRCKTSAQLIQTKFKRPFVFIWRKCYWSIGTILQSESGL